MHRTQGLPLHDVKTAPSVAFYFILQLTACADINTAEEAKTYYRRLFFFAARRGTYNTTFTFHGYSWKHAWGEHIVQNLFGSLSSGMP